MLTWHIALYELPMPLTNSEIPLYVSRETHGARLMIQRRIIHLDRTEEENLRFNSEEKRFG